MKRAFIPKELTQIMGVVVVDVAVFLKQQILLSFSRQNVKEAKYFCCRNEERALPESLLEPGNS